VPIIRRIIVLMWHLVLVTLKLISNTCRRSYIGWTSRNLKLRYQEHTRYIKHSESQSAYALHILNCRHEYGNISDTMTLLKHINKPSFPFPYEQMYIQLFHHNNQLIPEQHPNEQNPVFQLLHNRYHTSHPTWHSVNTSVVPGVAMMRFLIIVLEQALFIFTKFQHLFTLTVLT